jgi:hypothetical protein
MSKGRALALSLSLSLALPLGLPGQTLHRELAPLEALLDKDWRGLMKAPDGTADWEVVCVFRALWDGKAVRYTRTVAELKSSEEGTIYWDDMAKKIAFFSIQSNAAHSSGFLTVEKNVISFEGKLTWPAPPPEPGVKQAFDFRNTFELVSDSEMVDRWFQNAFGPWRPGHRILLKAQEKRAGPGPAAFRPPPRQDVQGGESGAIVIPESNGVPVLLDGRFSSGEWEDAKRIDIHESVSLFLKACGGHSFIGVRISPFRTSAVDMFISPGGERIHHLHASAQIGERLVNEASGRWDSPSFSWGATVDWSANEIRWDEKKMQAMIKEGKSEGEAQEMANYQYDGFEFQVRESKFGPGPWLFRIEVPLAPHINEPVVFPPGTGMKSVMGWARLAKSTG